MRPDVQKNDEFERGGFIPARTRWKGLPFVGFPSAEAALRLRALWTNGDFDDYWRFHLERERQRVLASRYADGRVPNPLAACKATLPAVK